MRKINLIVVHCSATRSNQRFTVTISPNPVKGQMTIATDYEQGKLCVHIVNAQGVEVRGFVMDKQTTIDVSDLPAGLYFVSVIGGKVVTQKVIIEWFKNFIHFSSSKWKLKQSWVVDS